MRKQVLIVIAKKDFRDEEYFVPKELLEDAGFQVATASNTNAGELALGARGGEAVVSVNLADVQSDNFDAIIFVGGSGAVPNLDNEKSYSLIRDFYNQGKLVAAICIAPTILAKAGVLKNKKATAWHASGDNSALDVLKTNGATCLAQDVVEDGNIITANGPSAAKEFGECLISYLNK